MARRLILAIVLAIAVCFLNACGSSKSGSSGQGTQSSVSIALNPPPSSTTIPVGSTTGIQFTPVVSNDSSNYGVDWAVTCPSPGACGTLSIAPSFHSASGTAVTYIPPIYFSTGSLSVNVTVFATADHTKNVTTAVTVSSYSNVLKGTYILQVKGSNITSAGTSAPYQSTGALVFDGSGNITSGEQILNTVSGFSTAYTVQGSGGTPSSYFIGPDGRGTITLNLQQTNNSTNLLLETFSLTVISSSKALIAELDSNSAAGSMELQDPTAAATQPTGAYAFVTSGTDSGSATNPLGGTPAPTGLGGVLNIDNNPSPGDISGNGSLADQDYYNATGTARAFLNCVPPTGVTGTVSQPSSFGAVTITLTGATCFGIKHPASIQFTGYIVDATHIRLIESDDLNGSGGFLTAGIAVSQGTTAGTFTAASLSGPYVAGVLGVDVNSGLPSSFTSVSVVKADGIGTLTGMSDTLFPGDSAAFTSTTLTGTYTVDASLIGRAGLKLTFKGPIPTPHPHFVLYLTGNGTPPLVLYAGGEDLNFPAIGAGIAYPQTANASTAFGNPETYGVSFTQQGSGAENDGTARMTSTSSSISGTLTGLADDLSNSQFTGTGPFSLLDSFTLPADALGRISGTFMNVPPGGIGPYVEYYLVDQNHGFFVETDLLNPSVALPGQVALGYLAQACDVTSSTSCQAAAQQSSRRSGRSSRGRVKDHE